MIFISHRGNIDGRIENKENNPDYIKEALNQGYDVEIDVWYQSGYYFGHNCPTYEIDISFLLQSRLWIHAKNIAALYELKNITNCFFHKNDDAVLTSTGYIWTYPGYPLTNKSICVMPETVNYSNDQLKNCYGICSDEIKRFKNIL